MAHSDSAHALNDSINFNSGLYKTKPLFNYNLLYNNTLFQFKSVDIIDNSCYILDKQIIINHNSRSKNVFSSFTGSSCKILDKPITRSEGSSDFFILPVVIGLVVMTSIFIRYGKYLVKFLEGFIYSYVVEKFVEDLNVPTRRLLIFLDFLSLVAFGFLFYEALMYFGFLQGISFGSFTIWAFLFATLLVYRIYYFIFHKSVGILMIDKTLVGKLFFESLIAIRGIGIVIFPLSVITFYISKPYDQYLLYSSFIIAILLLLYRIIRLLSLFIKNGISFLYFILYLCALEIVPFFILYIVVQRM
ncbi:MAG: DUF4271 domain-containing protein [Bacteroidales bacterium]